MGKGKRRGKKTDLVVGEFDTGDHDDSPIPLFPVIIYKLASSFRIKRKHLVFLPSHPC